MKEHHSKKISHTFSIPVDISQELHTYVRRRELSGFVSEAIRKELELKKNDLRKAYQRANKDEGQMEAKEWEDTLSDGSAEW